MSDSDTDTEAVEELEPRSEGLPDPAGGLPSPAEGLPEPTEGLVDPADFRMDSDTDVEDEEAGPEGAGALLIRSPSREKAPGGTSWAVPPPPQTCSTAPASTGNVDSRLDYLHYLKTRLLLPPFTFLLLFP